MASKNRLLPTVGSVFKNTDWRGLEDLHLYTQSNWIQVGEKSLTFALHGALEVNCSGKDHGGLR